MNSGYNSNFNRSGIESKFSAVKGKVGVLIVNLGTPDSTSTGDVRRYLRQFLMDDRVIDIPFLSRWFLVNIIIAPFRAPKSAEVYKKVWLPEGSPLKVYGYSVEKKLQAALGEKFVVKLGMRYQNPSIESAIKELQSADIERIIVVPFFPQYASATTGSVHQEVMRIVQGWPIIPDISFINQYFDHPGLIEGFAQSAKAWLDKQDYEHYVFSYHGLPERQLGKAYVNSEHNCEAAGCRKEITAENQHCYLAQCYETTKLIANRLGISPDKISTCFQSRLGKDPWIQPYTEVVVKELAAKGIKKVLAFSPAFVADCLETTEEVGIEYRDMFIEEGGEVWDLVESLNESDIWVNTLVDLVYKV